MRRVPRAFLPIAVLHRAQTSFSTDAQRLVTPSPQFPATGEGPANSSDPAVVWREYWSAEHVRPYYHNLATNETAWTVPVGFPTRYASFHKREGCTLDADDRVVTAVVADAPGGTVREAQAQPQAAAEGSSLKKQLAQYGAGGLLLYLIIHNISLATVFLLLWVFDVDLVGKIKAMGIYVPGGDKPHSGIVATFILAVGINKTMVPVQVLATLGLAPRFVHRLQPYAQVFSSWFKGH